MKQLSATLIISLSLIYVNAQEMINPLTKGTAPSFTAVSTTGKINFPEDYYGKWKILFSHPADFTPVCTSEILELAFIQEEFKKLKTALVVISTDGLNSHIEWVKSIESIDYNDLGKVKVDFPIVSDFDFAISRKYGILNSDSINKRDIRAVFFIDTYDQIRAMFYYPDNIGRNIDEIKRTLIALQTSDKHQVLTPANWKPGNEVLINSPSSMAEAEKLEKKNSKNLRKVVWYMWFKTI